MRGIHGSPVDSPHPPPPPTPPTPIPQASDTKLCCFLWSAPEQTVDQTIRTPVIWDAIAVIMTSLQWFPQRTFGIPQTVPAAETCRCRDWRWWDQDGQPRSPDRTGMGPRTAGTPGGYGTRRCTVPGNTREEGTRSGTAARLREFEAETKWPLFFRRQFQMHFLKWKCVFFLWIFILLMNCD